MKYGKARAIVESALEQLDEAAKKKPTKEEKAEAAFQRSLARLSARNAKNQKKYQKAAAANPRANISAHGRPVTKADVAAWHASKPKRSDGLREPYNYMGEAQLDEGTKRVARLRMAREKALSKGKKVGSIAKAEDMARQKYQRSEDRRELKPGAIENRMKWQKKYPGPSQPRGFGSYGF